MRYRKSTYSLIMTFRKIQGRLKKTTVGFPNCWVISLMKQEEVNCILTTQW